MKKIKLFYSYSHKDESYRKKLETHLSILRRNNSISEWHDRKISAGNEWEEDIDINLEYSDIILLLVSSNFLASDYCYDTETIRALEKHDSREAVVIPIILSPCLWQESELRKLQALPKKPISTFRNQDEGWLEAAKEILKKVKELQNQHPSKQKTLNKKINSSKLIIDFLNTYCSWYFSPLRIQKWGSKQNGFKELGEYSTKDIKKHLENYKTQGKVKTTKSRKGNIIYKIKY